MALRRMPAPLAISMGDPAGIGPEVILKAARQLARKRPIPVVIVVGDLGAMRAAARRLGTGPEPYSWTPGTQPAPLSRGLPVLGLDELSASAIRPGAPSVEGANAAYNYIVKGAQMALAG